MSGGALDGIRVLEFSQIIAGPVVGVNLSDLGADVIKVEPPGGEPIRNSGSVVPGESKAYQSYNRGKRGMVLDLHDPRGLQTAYRLIPHMDVVVTNYRPGVVQRIGHRLRDAARAARGPHLPRGDGLRHDRPRGPPGRQRRRDPRLLRHRRRRRTDRRARRRSSSAPRRSRTTRRRSRARWASVRRSSTVSGPARGSTSAPRCCVPRSSSRATP